MLSAADILSVFKLVMFLTMFIFACIYTLRAEIFVSINFEMATPDNVTSYELSFYSAGLLI